MDYFEKNPSRKKHELILSTGLNFPKTPDYNSPKEYNSNQNQTVTIMATKASKTQTASKAKSVTPKTPVNSAVVKGATIKAMYTVSQITNRTNKNLWVAFPAGQTSNGLVFSMSFTRDEVRNAMSKIVGTNISNIRSQRVSTFRKNG